MIIQEDTKKQEEVTRDIDFVRYYEENPRAFNKFNGWRDNCSRTVKEYLAILGVQSTNLTPWADTVRTLGPANYNPNDLLPGDVIAMGRPGDTWHVGVYMGDNKVLHQSGIRGYRVGVYADLNAFVFHRAGFYYVRPDYSPVRAKLVEDLIATPQPLTAPAIGG